MEADSRHFSVVILDEGQSSTTHLEKEICFRFGINIEGAWEGVLAPRLPEQMISFPPDRRFDAGRKRLGRRKFEVADAGIEEFRVQLDGNARFRCWVTFERLIGDFLVRESRAEEMYGYTSHLAPGIPGKGHGHAGRPSKKLSF